MKKQNQNLSSHVKRDKFKWFMTAVAIFAICAMLVGMGLQLFGQGKVKPSEWFSKPNTPNGSTVVPDDDKPDIPTPDDGSGNIKPGGDDIGDNTEDNTGDDNTGGDNAGDNQQTGGEIVVQPVINGAQVFFTNEGQGLYLNENADNLSISNNDYFVFTAFSRKLSSVKVTINDAEKLLFSIVYRSGKLYLFAGGTYSVIYDFETKQYGDIVTEIADGRIVLNNECLSNYNSGECYLYIATEVFSAGNVFGVNNVWTTEEVNKVFAFSPFVSQKA